MSEQALPERLPNELTDRDQWVCWQTEDRDGKSTKIPVDPSTGRFASTTDPSTWCSFDRAHEHAQDTEEIAGLGFVFTDADPFVGVDLDDCRDPNTGRPTELAKEIVDRLDSYTEVSPSGTGYHVIVRGNLPEGRNRHGDIECYATSRYFPVTGDHVSGTPEEVEERSDALAAVHTDHVATETPDKVTEAQRPTISLDDREIVQKATQATNGERFERLWNGSTAAYPSHSEADMALCCQLAFWTGGDPVQMDRLFRDSGLMREKWDEVHFADGSTYGATTVSRAIDRVSEQYNPSKPDEEADVGRSPETERRSGEEHTGVGAHRNEERLRETIERLDRRIETLEAENERLRDQLEEESLRQDRREESAQPGETTSLLTRLKRIVDSTAGEIPEDR